MWIKCLSGALVNSIRVTEICIHSDRTFSEPRTDVFDVAAHFGVDGEGRANYRSMGQFKSKEAAQACIDAIEDSLIGAAVLHDVAVTGACDLCGKPSPRSLTHLACANREQFEADQVPSKEIV